MVGCFVRRIATLGGWFGVGNEGGILALLCHLAITAVIDWLVVGRVGEHEKPPNLMEQMFLIL